MDRITPSFITSLKGKRKIVAVTAYDYPSAYYAQKAGVDVILVGDSLGMVVKGEQTTLNVTLQEVAYHTKAVSKAEGPSLIVADMPFLSYITPLEAVRNAGVLVRAGAMAVKIEGARVKIIEALIQEGIPVMGHVGLTPQYFLKIGFKTQGKSSGSALRLVEDALKVEEAGAFSIVLESIPWKIAKEITKRVSIPTIGIGAGPHCDGQILVFHDLLGFYPGKKPSFVREYAKVGEIIENGLRRYAEDVINGDYPSIEESFPIKEQEYLKFMEALNGSNKEN